MPALRGRQCDIDSGVCVDRVSQSLAPTTACQSTQICTRENANFASVCRGPEQACVPLETPDCYISGDWEAEDALFIGSISPQTLRFADGELSSNPYVTRALFAIDLGLEEWSFALPGGLPVSARPLAIVHCDSGGDSAQAQRVMDHLVDTVHADAVFVLADIDLPPIAARARESGTALVCATCYTAGANADAPDAWRMQPPLAEQAPMMAWRLADLERRLRESQGLPADAALRVALLSQAYPGINELVEQVRSTVLAEGGAGSVGADNFLELQSPDPRNESFSQPELARAIVDFAPSVILIAVDSDFTTYYLRMIEEAWLAGTPRPNYVVTSMNEEVGLLAPIVGADDELRRRISGTAFFGDAEVLQNRSRFADRFRRRHLEEPDNVEAAYDAFYAVAFSLVLRDSQGGLDTVRLTPGFEDLSRGSSVDVGSDGIQSAIGYLTQQRSIDLVGTSTRLDWDSSTHDVTSDIGMWCLERTPSGALAINPDAGPRLERATGQVNGTYSCE